MSSEQPGGRITPEQVIAQFFSLPTGIFGSSRNLWPVDIARANWYWRGFLAGWQGRNPGVNTISEWHDGWNHGHAAWAAVSAAPELAMRAERSEG